DGDPIPTSALRTPDGEPGLLARYFNAAEPPPARFAPGELDAWIERTGFAREPVVTRVEPDVNSRSLDLAQVHDVHRVEWTGYLVPPETGTYRLGLGGFNGELEFDGKPFVDLRGAAWNSLPTLGTVHLEGGRRSPIRVGTEARILAGIGLQWKRVADSRSRASLWSPCAARPGTAWPRWGRRTWRAVAATRAGWSPRRASSPASACCGRACPTRRWRRCARPPPIATCWRPGWARPRTS